jgi:two-component system sensor histidine kinase QseC
MCFRNLIDNAIRYTPEYGQVSVDIQEAPNGLLVNVSDNGPGVPPEKLNRIFDRFYRYYHENTSGSGLGLSIVQQIVRLHEGTVTVKHNMPQGLVFTVTLPYVLTSSPP